MLEVYLGATRFLSLVNSESMPCRQVPWQFPRDEGRDPAESWCLPHSREDVWGPFPGGWRKERTPFTHQKRALLWRKVVPIVICMRPCHAIVSRKGVWLEG